MANRVPAGFTPLEEAQKRRDGEAYDVIGVCTDYLPPAHSRGSDLTMKMTLWDGSCLQHPDLGQDGMVVRYFAKSRWHMPRVEEIGDVVILRNLRTKLLRGQWYGLSNHETKWNVIPGSTLLENADSPCQDVMQREPYDGRSATESRQGRPLTAKELQYAKALLQMKDPATFRAPPKSTALDVAAIMRESGGWATPVVHKKFRLLKDLVDPRGHDGYQFVDLIGEVRRVYHGSNPVEIMLTDYTEHPLLYNYCKPTDTRDGDPFGYAPKIDHWDGPWGRKTITLRAWDEQAEVVRDLAMKGEIKLGMIMQARNVNIQLDRNGGMIQGNLRGGAGNTGTHVSFLRPREAEHNEELKAFLARKRNHDREQRDKAISFAGTNSTTNKRPAPDSADDLAQQQKKNKMKNARKKTRRDQEANETAKHTLPNQHVRCEATEIPLTTVSSILDQDQLERKTPAGNPFRLPFQNCKYRSKIQVIDFFPDNLEDFATPFKALDYDVLSDNEGDDGSVASADFVRSNPDSVRWEWHFFLIVQDPSPASRSTRDEGHATMLLQVVGQDGDYLLNMEACDLRTDKRALARMKEKLFVLWGDLEEKKSEHGKTGMELRNERVAVSSKSFECLIKEFGVNARSRGGEILREQWERMFGLFKTNIG